MSARPTSLPPIDGEGERAARLAGMRTLALAIGEAMHLLSTPLTALLFNLDVQRLMLAQGHFRRRARAAIRSTGTLTDTRFEEPDMLDARREQSAPVPQPPLDAAHALERTPLSDNSCVLRQVAVRKAAPCRVWSLAAELPRRRN